MNPKLTTCPTSDPARALQYRDGLYAVDLLTAAVAHLDFFTWLDAHPGLTAGQICAQLGFVERPVDVLLTLCRANGFVQTDGNGGNTLTPVAREHLVRSSPWYLGPYYDSLKDRPAAVDYVSVFRTGKPARFASAAEKEDWHKAMLREDFARQFTAGMDCRGLALGQVLAKALAPHINGRTRVLDIGGGSGIYVATLVAAHPHLSGIVLEQAPVDAIARRALAGHGLSGRVDVVTANMFTDSWPAADIHLLSNVLHDWYIPEVRAILKQSAAHLPVGGLLVIHEVFITDDKTGPLPAAEYSAMLMHGSQGKCYTCREYSDILQSLGFQPGPYQDTLGGRGFMTAVKTASC